ncbi:oxygen-independent coproporphyrinogen III oxidase [Desertivirga brevis]|uniref:oxygen-independent coproporphyrinogen III oxidase n=1 Tax=Desertivirga brevis TaxID=2810310 RepID=UPI001A9745DA|nr:oxygen-independent coproporphyrinogen III oxidase [Pedobacter sp. SYSU D00873]
MNTLISKYNVAAPRYTSYPTVPLWEEEQWSIAGWIDTVRKAMNESSAAGISLYIHLPYCESLCTYCGCNTRITRNHTVEKPYIESVLKEWQMYKEVIGTKPRIREIHLGGGTPTFFSPENLKFLMEGLLEGTTLASETSFSFEGHPANTSYDHLKALYQAGFRRVSLGIQDFDPVVQEIINRKQSYEQVRKVTIDARTLGYTSINYDLIYGLPLQKLSSIEDTVEKVISLMPDRIAFYSYAHVPWVKPGQRRFTEADLPQDEEKRALYEKGREMLLNKGYYDIGMDHFSLDSDNLYIASKNQKLHRNFMGYTDQYTQLSIGLGVSSISDSWYGFSQNVKQVEQYHELISKGSFPLIKGHILTEEDLVFRKHILDLMCMGYTDCEWLSPEFAPVRERLVPLESDGLVVVKEGRVQITVVGKAFLRNICMAFDIRLWQKKPESQLFSKAI